MMRVVQVLLVVMCVFMMFVFYGVFQNALSYGKGVLHERCEIICQAHNDSKVHVSVDDEQFYKRFCQ